MVYFLTPSGIVEADMIVYVYLKHSREEEEPPRSESIACVRAIFGGHQYLYMNACSLT